MKSTLISMFSMLGSCSATHAENLINIYHHAQLKAPQLQGSKAISGAASETINESRATLLPQINLTGSADYQKSHNDGDTFRHVAGQVSLDQSVYHCSNRLSLNLTEKSTTQMMWPTTSNSSTDAAIC